MPKRPRRRWGTIDELIPGEKYRIRWPEGRKDDGKRKPPSKIVYGTWDDAELALAVKHIQLTGPGDSTTWEQFWIAKVEPTLASLAERTAGDYGYYWSRCLLPQIGHERVCDTDYARACEVMDGISPVSAWRYSYAIFKKVCNMAVHETLLASNPVDRTIPRPDDNKRPQHELSIRDLVPLLLAARGTRYMRLALCCMCGGMRPEETYALCSWDVRRDGRYAAADVYKTLTVAGSRAVFQDRTKTPMSSRRILFAEPFATLLLEDVAQCDGPLFPGPRPSGMEPNATWFAHPDRIRRNWKEWCGRHGVDYVRPGDMRTIYSDWHGEAQTPDALVSMSMGHKHKSTRGKNYMNWTRKDAERVADSLAAYVAEEVRCAHLLEDGMTPKQCMKPHVVSQIPESSQFMVHLTPDF